MLSPDEYKAFLTYADNRSMQAARYGQNLGDTEGVTYRSPEEFRTLLGLNKETDRAAQ